MTRKTLVPELRDADSRKALAEVVSALLGRWQLTAADRLALLGLEGRAEPKPGEALPDNPALLERAGHLLAIDRALARLYPYQPGLRDRWVSLAEPRLAGRRPLDVMLAGGIEGIRAVRDLVESRTGTRTG